MTDADGARRIFGLETEYGVQHWNPEGRALSPEEVVRYLFRPVVEWGRSSNVFVSNGSRLYLDVGSHPEYATAEAATLRDVVAQDVAGERIVDGLIGGNAARTLVDTYVFVDDAPGA